MGLILCADKRDEQIEFLELDQSGIRVASHLTDLPPKKLLEQKLHESASREICASAPCTNQPAGDLEASH
jgi:hypothetical protein